MNRTLCNVLLFTVGAAIGSAVTWKVVTYKYDRLVQEEIDSVKEEYKAMRDVLYSADAVATNKKVKQELQNEVEVDDSEDVFEPSSDEVFEYHKIASNYRSSEENDNDEEEGGMGDPDEPPYVNEPYVISPDDFRCSPPGYNAQALDYFANGVLADGWGKVMDIEETIGEESLSHIGDYEDYVMYVRNDRLEIDYEITFDPRSYDEVYNSHYNA